MGDQKLRKYNLMWLVCNMMFVDWNVYKDCQFDKINFRRIFCKLIFNVAEFVL